MKDHERLRRTALNAQRAERMDLTFYALSDASRRSMIERLTEGEATVNELVEHVVLLTQPAITKHLKVLERAGLVTRSREGRSRPVRLRADPLTESEQWLAHYREVLEQTYGRLDDLLVELQPKTKAHTTKEKNHEPKQTRNRRTAQ